MHETTSTADQLMTRLAEAASGLLYPSESDFPLTPVRFHPGGADEAPTPEAILRWQKRDPATPVAAIGVDDFFAPVMKSPEEGGSPDATRYRALLDLLGHELADLRALRVGSVDIDVYILGRHASGAWLGLSTHLVET